QREARREPLAPQTAPPLEELARRRRRLGERAADGRLPGHPAAPDAARGLARVASLVGVRPVPAGEELRRGVVAGAKAGALRGLESAGGFPAGRCPLAHRPEP